MKYVLFVVLLVTPYACGYLWTTIEKMDSQSENLEEDEGPSDYAHDILCEPTPLVSAGDC